MGRVNTVRQLSIVSLEPDRIPTVLVHRLLDQYVLPAPPLSPSHATVSTLAFRVILHQIRITSSSVCDMRCC